VSLSRTRTKLIERLKDRKGRRREAAVLVEGVRGAEEALASGVPVRFAVVTPELEETERGTRLRASLQAAGTDLEGVSAEELARLSDTQEPQGVALVVDEPERWSVQEAGGAAVLIADAVQDPGNLGALVRTARAFGLVGLLALDGTVDPWNPKCVRAAAGALFHLGVARLSWTEAREALEAGGYDLYAGGMSGTPVEEIEPAERWALAIGNEGRGVREELRVAAHVISVPMAGEAESLNAGVAGAILLYALSRNPT